MKKILGIIILSIIFFSAGSIFGTGSLDTKSTIRNVDSFQTKTIELGYRSVIDMWTAFKQVEVLMLASQENIDSTLNRFRDEQVKIAVAGFVNYKNANKSQPEIYSSGNQSVLVDEKTIPAITQQNDLLPRRNLILKPIPITDSTTNSSTDVLIDSPQSNRNIDAEDE